MWLSASRSSPTTFSLRTGSRTSAIDMTGIAWAPDLPRRRGRRERAGTVTSSDEQGPTGEPDRAPVGADEPIDVSATMARDDGSTTAAVAVAEIPFLPEPGDTSRADIDRRQFTESMGYMARALHVLGGNDTGPVRRSFELRLVAPGASAAEIAMFFLVHSAAPSDRSQSSTRELDVRRDAARALRHLLSLAPTRLTCSAVSWETESGAARQKISRRAGVDTGFAWRADLRKFDLLTWVTELDPLSRADRIERSRRTPHRARDPRGHVFPASFPRARGDLLSVMSAMSGAPGELMLRVILTPTRLTQDEYRAASLLDHDLALLVEKNNPDAPLAARARAAVHALLAAHEVFSYRAAVYGEDRESVRSVTAAWRMEFDRAAGRSDADLPVATDPVALPSATRGWLAFDERPPPDAGGAAEGADTGMITLPAVARTPGHGDVRDHDQQTDPGLLRVSGLMSAGEAAALWRLPAVRPGGQSGLPSKPVNPFEQLPQMTRENFGGLDKKCLSIGRVRHRGYSLPADFVLPASEDNPAGVNVLDRVMLVVGSPGSGKTNFACGILEQIDALGTPFLVIDPTRGAEFRGLSADRLVVYTVGERQNPLRFNPFAVPLQVNLQTHITRLMTCFRAAFWLWDPLPAIFEEAITEAYARKLFPRGRPSGWRAAQVKGEDIIGREPTLRDVVRAMGTGAPGERDTVLAGISKMWSAGGNATENQATIVASTSVRLSSLERTYGHIIGDAGRFTDVARLLGTPAVLEFGAIGDSQALALISSFLLVSLVGEIETARRDGYHMLVLEEAHRLLASTAGATARADSADPSAQAAQDLNNLLAEVRKYNQGVMILDQRPGSLVGGVIDNAYVVAMHRLGERAGFEHLSDMLNLSVEQRRYARVGLDVGEAVVLDRLLGAPVLVRPELRDRPPPADWPLWRDRADQLLSNDDDQSDIDRQRAWALLVRLRADPVTARRLDLLGEQLRIDAIGSVTVARVLQTLADLPFLDAGLVRAATSILRDSPGERQ